MHYRFISTDEFAEMRERGDLLEWAEVHGNFYGTPRKPVEQALARGEDMMFDIDWQGTRQICEKMRADVVSVFVLPPSMAELKARLERRAEDTPRGHRAPPAQRARGDRAVGLLRLRARQRRSRADLRAD